VSGKPTKQPYPPPSINHEVNVSVQGQVFAYGQTGAGKTYTMGTAVTAKQMRSLQEEGVIPKALKLIFEALPAIKQEYTIVMKVNRNPVPAPPPSPRLWSLILGLATSRVHLYVPESWCQCFLASVICHSLRVGAFLEVTASRRHRV